jgi:hypothetical protein
MSRRGTLRSTGTVMAALILGYGISGLVWANSPECARLDETAAAKTLGVQKTRANPSNGKHSKQSPDNMDVMACGYAEDTPDPAARVLQYSIYTPIPKDLASVFSAMASSHAPGGAQTFSPGIGNGSTGWVRMSANGETFDGSVVFQVGATFVNVKVSQMPSLDAAKSALLNASKLLSKP